MNRRRLLKLSGLLTAGSVSVVGSGAFSAASNKRTVTIDVVDDQNAYLGLNAIGTYGRAAEFGDGQIAFSIPGFREDTSDDTSGSGIAPNSTYTFGDLVRVTNQGEDTVEVWSKPGNLTPGIDRLSLIDSEMSGEILDEKSKAIKLTPGEGFDAGLFIDSGSELGNFDVSLSIMAEQPSASGGSVPGGTTRQLAVQNTTPTGPTTGDRSGVQFELVNDYPIGGPITIAGVSVMPADGDIDLVSDRQGGTNYDDYKFNADVHIEATPQDGYVDAGGTEFQLPTTVNLGSSGFSDSADQEAILDPGTVATVNLYSFRRSDGKKVDMAGKRIDLVFSVSLPDGSTDTIHLSVTP